MASEERQQQIGAAYIPAHIMCDQDLTITQKVLWGRIQGLSTKSGYCYASNGWIGDQLGLKKGTVSNLISQLVDGGYLLRKLIRNEAGEITERWLYPVCKQLEGVSTQELIGVSTQELPGIHAEVEGGIHAEVEGSVRELSDREESKEQTLPSDKPKMKKEDLARLTEKFAELQGARPRGKAWLPIQQGMKAMAVHEGYPLEAIEGCMIRMDKLGWTWTMPTLRRWIAAFDAGTMPVKCGNGNGKRPIDTGGYRRGPEEFADMGGVG